MNVKYRVRATNEDGAKTVVKAKKFEMVIDEPANLGGTNEGPNPLEYLLAALCGCLSVSGRLVAKEMGFTLRSMEWTLVGELDPGKFMGTSSNNRSGYETISVQCTADADTDEETLAKWADAIEDRCPVSDNIQHATSIHIDVNRA